MYLQLSWKCMFVIVFVCLFWVSPVSRVCGVFGLLGTEFVPLSQRVLLPHRLSLNFIKKRFSASLKLTSRICLLLNRAKDILKGFKGPHLLKNSFFFLFVFIFHFLLLHKRLSVIIAINSIKVWEVFTFLTVHESEPNPDSGWHPAFLYPKL